MKLRTFIYVVLALLVSSNSQAEEVQEIERLRQAVLEHTSAHYRDSFGHKHFDENVKVHVGRLDSRLRLARCDDNLTFKIQEPPHNVKNITVKTSCRSDKRWTVYVPVTLDIYADVLVSARSLQRGDILSEEDVTYRRVDIAAIGRGHIVDVERAVGMAVQRPIKIGDVVRLTHLEPAEIIAKGQTVVVTSLSRFLSVETSAVALTSGHLGQHIKVRNASSNRILSAEVVAPGKVTVANR